PKEGDNSVSDTGIRALGAIVAHGVGLFSDGVNDENGILRKVAKFFVTRHDIPSLRTASEVTGVLLKSLSKMKTSDWNGTIGNVVRSFIDCIIGHVEKLAKDSVRFIRCAQNIHLHFPTIAGRFLNQLTFILPSLDVDSKATCLDLIATGIDVQSTYSNAGELDKYFLGKTVEADSLIKDNPSAFAWSIKLQDTMKLRSELFLAALRRGVADSDSFLRHKCLSFWSDKADQFHSIAGRLIDVLLAIHAAETESRLLPNVLYLVLQTTAQSPDYERSPFPRPLLNDAEYTPYAVVATARRMRGSAKPLFASVGRLSSRLGGSQASVFEATVMRSIRSGSVGEKRGGGEMVPSGSVNGHFDITPTQADGGMDWVTQQTFENPSFDGSQLPSYLTPASRRKTVKRTHDVAFKLPKAPGSSDGNTGNDSFKLIKRRFVKSEDVADRSLVFKKMEERRKVKEERESELKRIQRVEEVHLLKNYAAGPVPDIQMPYKDLVRPLQALAEARVDLVLKSSTLPHAPVVASICDVLWSVNGKIDVVSGQLVRCSNSTGEQFAAAAALEEALYDSLKEPEVCKGILNMIKVTDKFSDAVQSALAKNFADFKKYQKEILQGKGLVTKDEAGVLSSFSDHLDGVVAKTLFSAIISGIARETKMKDFLKKFGAGVDLVLKSSTLPHAPVVASICDVLWSVNGKIDVDSGQLVRCSNSTGEQFAAAAALEEALISKLPISWHFKEYDFEIDSPKTKTGKLIWLCLLELRQVSRLAKNFADFKKYQKEILQGKGLVTKDEAGVLSSFSDHCAVTTGSVAGLCKSRGNNLNWVWDVPEFLDRYLPMLFRTSLKKVLLQDGPESKLIGEFKILFDFVKDAENGPDSSERREILEVGFAFEMALIEFKHKNFVVARRLIDKRALGGLAAQWAVATSDRRERILDLHRLVDLKTILEICTEPDWKQLSLYKSLLLFYVKHVEKTFPKKLDDEAKKAKFRLAFQVAKVAGDGRNMEDFEKWRRRAEDFARGSAEKAEVRLLEIKRKLSDSELLPSDEDAFKKAVDSWISWDNVPDDSMYWDYRAFVAQFVASKILTKEEVFAAFAEDWWRNVGDAFGFTDTSSPRKILDGLLLCSWQQLKKCVDEKPDDVVALMRLLNFCHENLTQWRTDEIPLARSAMESLLRALKNESKDAWQMIPVGLQLLVNHANDTAAVFSENISGIPEWMFLHWIPQMTGMLNLVESAPLRPLLLTLVENYPKAVYFPLRCSAESWKFRCQFKDAECYEFCSRLMKLVADDVLEDLVTSLGFVSSASVVLQAFKDNIKRLWATKANIDEYLHLADDLEKFFFGPCEPHDESGLSLRGPYFDVAAKRMKVSDIISSVISWKDMNSTGLSLETEIKQLVKDIEKASDMDDSRKSPIALSEYSPWLAGVSFVGKGVEMPGQYVGFGAPDVQNFVTISSFGPRVETMTSLRAPKTVTIRGSDGNETKWLVKYGEDLRMDERIQKLFGIMNEVFEMECPFDPAGDAFRIETYAVIPLTQTWGMIQWVKDTVSLNEAIFRADNNREMLVNYRRAAEGKYGEFLRKFGSKEEDIMVRCRNMYLKEPMDPDMCEEFFQVLSTLPSCMLRDMARSSASSFYLLKRRFAVSWAVMSVCHWVLGIGDRHLGNTLISTRNGSAVGIDFGRSFGYGVIHQSVPELVPFRLTPRILGVLAPYGVEGKFKSTMISTLTALRKHQKVLLATMSVFVWEPSLDWARNNAIFSKDEIESSGESEKAWYPEKIKGFVRDKLNGANPASITRQELLMGKHNKENCAAYCKVLFRKSALRNAYPSSGLSAEEQVDCLIDQATDISILARIFSGWSPHV
ncbi:unnamed protein product, partial [Notodromas monacha]